jgi:DNA primase
MNNYTHHAQTINDSLTMPDIIARYIPHTPRNNRIPCAIHGGVDYNMHYVDYGYYCWVCGEKGGVIQFTQKVFGLTFRDAVEKLNMDFGLNLPIGRRMTLREQRQAEQRRNEVVQKRAEQAKQKQAYEDKYWLLWDEWIRLDNNSRQYGWSDPDGQPDDEYVEAMCRLDVVWDKIVTEL